MTTKSMAAPARRRLIATCMTVAALLFTSVGNGQVGQAPSVDGSIAGNVQKGPAPVMPESLSCSDLKDRLKTAGELNILSGPNGGWGDTFYGPAVPRCQFWQQPEFTYVRARDGRCGVGYICVEKYTVD